MCEAYEGRTTIKEFRLVEVEWQDNGFYKVCNEIYMTDMLLFMIAHLGCMKTALG